MKKQHVGYLVKHYDLIVAGGGTAGTAAAVSAARNGLKTLLIEESNCLGGTSTAGCVNEWFAQPEGVGSIFHTIHTVLMSHNYAFGRHFNGEALKWIWQDLCMEAGVDILFHASLLSVSKRNRRLRSIKVLASSRKLEFTADYFVDATGEGDLAFLAGAEFMKGHPDNGRQLHMSLVFLMVKSCQTPVPYLPENETAYETFDDIPGLGVHGQLEDGRIYCNLTKIMGLDSTDPFELSQAEMEARRQMMKAVHFLQRTRYPEYIPVTSGAHIGIREGRRVVCDYTLKAAEVIAGTSFSDGTVVGTSQIDFHSLTRRGTVGWRQKLKPYAIPYRCFCVKGLSNLLVTGKCIGVDQIVHSSSRMTPTCCGMGECVGLAVSLAIQQRVKNIRKIPMKELHVLMANAGFFLNPEDHQPFHPSDDYDGSPEDIE